MTTTAQRITTPAPGANHAAPAGYPSEVLRTLMDLAIPAMTRNDASRLAGAVDIAETLAHQMAELVENIGVLINNDAASVEAGGLDMGTLRAPRDVASTLFTIGQIFDLIAGLTSVGAGARFRADQMDQEGRNT